MDSTEEINPHYPNRRIVVRFALTCVLFVLALVATFSLVSLLPCH